MLAGPGSSSLIAFYQEHNTTMEIISSIAILPLQPPFYHSKSAHYLAKILGASGIIAISRIVGFIVIAIEYNICECNYQYLKGN
jgi:multiple antibiotic resistance protein